MCTPNIIMCDVRSLNYKFFFFLKQSGEEKNAIKNISIIRVRILKSSILNIKKEKHTHTITKTFLHFLKHLEKKLTFV